MRIGLDTTWINLRDGGGRYTNEMLAHLCGAFPECEFVAFGPRPRRRHDYPNLTVVEYPEVLGMRARIAYVLRMGGLAARHRVDVFHNLCNYGFYNAPCPMVTTIHDLLTIKFPELRASRVQYWLYRFYLRRLLRRTTWIVSDSAQTTSDLRELYGIANRVETVLLGYDAGRFGPTADGDDEVLGRVGLEPGYLLFVGHLVPKKNLGVVIDALSWLRTQRGLTPQLALAGTRGDRAETVFAQIEAAGLTPNVRELGFIADTDLPALYRQARLVLFPSRYEGFGLPVLEAMACGTPVLSSPVGAVPEILANAEYLCSPTAPAVWAERIERCLIDPSWCAAARAWGLERAGSYSWQRCVRQVMHVYERVAGGGG